MYHVTETKKQNIRKQADRQHASEATFAVLRHGGVLLKSGTRTRNIEGEEAASFISKVRDKGAGYVKKLVQGYFEPVTA